MSDFEYVCDTLADLADYIEVLAKGERDGIGDKSSKRDAMLRRERASTYENVAHLIRRTKLRSKE